MKVLPIGIILVLLLPLFFISITNSYTNNTTYTVEYSKYTSFLQTGKIAFSNEIYVVSNTTYYGNLSNDKTVQVTQYKTIYTLVTGESKTIHGKICVSSYANGSLYVKTNIPQLARIIVLSANMEEIVWAGFNESCIRAFSYINGTGELILQFINGTSISNISLEITHSTICKSLTLTLVQVSVSSKVQSISSLMIHVQMPRKYSPLTQCFTTNGSTFSSTEGYIVTTACFCGKLMPAIEWKGLGIGSINMPIKMGGKANFTTLEFYGINGTAVGYVHSVYLNFESSNKFGIISMGYSFVSGELLIVHISTASTPSKPSMSVIYHNGVPIILGIYNNTIETTANVAIQHQVYVNHARGLLLMLCLNSSIFYVGIIHSNVINVTVVKPTVTISNVTIQGKSYLTQIVNISASGYITFNVSKISNENFSVFEQESNGSLVKLNSCDYFTVNNTIVVFTDPANTYLIVYGYSPSTSSSVNSTTTTPVSYDTLFLIIAVIVIIAIIAVIILRRR